MSIDGECRPPYVWDWAMCPALLTLLMCLAGAADPETLRTGGSLAGT